LVRTQPILRKSFLLLISTINFRSNNHHSFNDVDSRGISILDTHIVLLVYSR
jgi:hypothetical protein